MLLDDDRMRNRKTLPSPFPDRLRRKEWVEHFGLDCWRDSAAGVRDSDFRHAVAVARADVYSALFARIVDDIRNGMGGVDNQVQNYLVEFSADTLHWRQVRIEVGR